MTTTQNTQTTVTQTNQIQSQNTSPANSLQNFNFILSPSLQTQPSQNFVTNNESQQIIVRSNNANSNTQSQSNVISVPSSDVSVVRESQQIQEVVSENVIETNSNDADSVGMLDNMLQSKVFIFCVIFFRLKIITFHIEL